MRAAISFRLLALSTLALGAAGCDDSDSPFEPAPEQSTAPASVASERWADAYLVASLPATASYTPSSVLSYNRGGGPITVTKPSGTTGRYVATFRGLSLALGGKSTVHVTAVGSDDTFCKPMSGFVVSDQVEVRCFRTATGAPVNTTFSLLVLRKSEHRAFAFAHRPLEPGYTPSAAGSWNPSGTTRVTRHSPGYYQVTFNNFGTQFPPYFGGHVQVHAVASAKAHCKVAEEYGGSPHFSVMVQCYTLSGQPADAKFTVLVDRPGTHLAYAFVRSSMAAVEPFWSSNPTGGATTVQRHAAGVYTVTWAGIDAEIVDYGNVQVTPVGYNDYALCKVFDVQPTSVGVKCFAPKGVLADAWFTVLLGS